MFAYVCG